MCVRERERKNENEKEREREGGYLKNNENFSKKAKWIFPHKVKFCIVWNWFVTKTILISPKYLWWFNVTVNKTQCWSLEQRSLGKFLVAKKCKPSENFWSICSVYGEKCFSEKCFSLLAWFENSMEWKHWLSGKDNLPGAVTNKEDHVDTLRRHERIYDYWFPRKDTTVNCFLWPKPSAKKVGACI